MDRRELVRQAKKGNNYAIQVLWEQLAPVWRNGYKYHRPKILDFEDVESIVKEAFFTAIDKYKGENYRTFVANFALNCRRNIKRAEQKEAEFRRRNHLILDFFRPNL